MGQNQPQKLVLSRETVRDLTKDELVGIEGGKGHDLPNTEDTTVASGPPWPCPRCCL